MNKKQCLFLLFLVLIVHCSYATRKPWFTGPIENNANVMLKKDQWYFFPDIYQTRFEPFTNYGGYVQLAYGFTDKWQVQIFPRYNYNTNGIVSSHGVGQFPFLVGYQITTQQPDSYMPAIKLNIKQSLPTNRYDNFDPSKGIVDSMGPAFYQTAFLINTQYMLLPRADHYLMTYFTAQYAFHPSKHVAGFNDYGGGFGTDGSMAANQRFNMDLTLELEITQNWAVLFEWYYIYVQSSDFSGLLGVNEDGTPAQVFKPRVNQWSLFPTLEYSFNKHLGILAGVWFSVNNRMNQFRSIQIALNYIS